MPEEIILSPLPESESEFIFVTAEFKAKTAKEVLHFMEVQPSFERTYVIVVASHRERGRNFVNRISCKKGLPIGGYIYDSQTDSYHIECADYLHLGYVPVSFTARIKGLDHWEARVPMPENVLRKYLSTLQKKELRNFKHHFKAEDYEVQYVQMIDPN